MRSANVLVVIGAVLALLGIVGFAIPVFTTRDTKEVAKIGDLKLQTTEANEGSRGGPQQALRRASKKTAIVRSRRLDLAMNPIASVLGLAADRAASLVSARSTGDAQGTIALPGAKVGGHERDCGTTLDPARIWAREADKGGFR